MARLIRNIRAGMALLLAWWVAFPFSATATADQGAGARPNFVFILLDDMDLYSPMWKALRYTEQHVKNQGLTFTRAFAPTPICCPARISILTGLYGHNTGVLTLSGRYGGIAAVASPYDQDGQRQTNDDGHPLSNEERMIGPLLEKAGYETVLIGKYVGSHDHRPGFVPPGWTEWHQLGGHAMYTGLDYSISHWRKGIPAPRVVDDYSSRYSTDVFGEIAVAFLERRQNSGRHSPFFMWFGPTAPHLPIKPAPRHKYESIFPWKRVDRWKDEFGSEPFFNLVRRFNYDERDLSDKPAWLRRDETEQFRSRAVAYADGEYQDRMGSLYAVDEAIKRIIETLRRTGELDNTVFVLTSDNGYNLGAHRLIHKMAPYEESLRIPLVMAGPGIRKGTTDAMTLLIDLAPTWLELAGLEPPATMDGISLKPLLEHVGVPDTWRKDFLAQYLGGYVHPGYAPPSSSGMREGYKLDLPTYRALRTERFTYVEWLPPGQYPYRDEERPYEPELYDLLADPYQMENLLRAKPAPKREHWELAARFHERLWELAKCKGEACRH